MWWNRRARCKQKAARNADISGLGQELFTLRQVDSDFVPTDGWFTMESDKIVFDWDEGVRSPLWSEDGHLPEDAAWLSGELGLTDELIADLQQWCHDMQATNTYKRRLTRAEREARDRAGELVSRLRTELAGRFTVYNGPDELDEAERLSRELPSETD